MVKVCSLTGDRESALNFREREAEWLRGYRQIQTQGIIVIRLVLPYK